MKVIHNCECNSAKNGIIAKRDVKSAVALGNFDGLHLGHAKLIEEITKRKGKDSYVYTFEVHPNKFISDGKTPLKLMTNNRQKADILESMGVGHVFFENFECVRDMSPADFVKDVLIGTFNCGVAVCGYNFSFGKKGEGNSEFLRDELAKYGAECVIVEPVTQDGVPVSSTRIRGLIENGDVDEAAKLLGRPFALRRPVLHGKMLGRTFGIPTINQSFDKDFVKPAKAVYVCRVELEGKVYPAVCDVGTKPTVSGKELLAETHIIGYDGDLYGKTVEVAFLKKLRPEEKFADTNELKTAIENDIADAKKYFGIV